MCCDTCKRESDEQRRQRIITYIDKLQKETAVLYNQYGDRRYYRTKSGQTFSVQGNDYFYYGNVIEGSDSVCIYIPHDLEPYLFSKIEFKQV